MNKNNNSYSMSYFSGYPLKNTITGTMNIDNKKTFVLRVINFSEASGSKHAVIEGLVKDDINFLISGTRLTIEIDGVDNSKLLDRFSLMGFTNSINYVLSSCN